jgi:PIN domain nuclease of toxin-antitoxin system
MRSKTALLYMSAVTAWEIAIKYALNSLPLHMEPALFIPEVIRGLAMQPLDITSAHAVDAMPITAAPPRSVRQNADRTGKRRRDDAAYDRSSFRKI